MTKRYFECYYYKIFPSTTNENEYLKHVVNYHNKKPIHLPLNDLAKKAF